MKITHPILLIIVAVLMVLSWFLRPKTFEGFEESTSKEMKEEGATNSLEKDTSTPKDKETEKESTPTPMDKINEIRKTMKCPGNIELKDPEIMYNLLETMLQCSPMK
jgi:hypothetical protein